MIKTGDKVQFGGMIWDVKEVRADNPKPNEWVRPEITITRWSEECQAMFLTEVFERHLEEQ